MKRQHAALGLIMLALALLPLHRGGYPLLPQLIFGALASVALLLTTNDHRRPGDLLFNTAVCVWLGWLAWQLFQIVQLPPGLLSAVAPESAQAWAEAHNAGVSGKSSVSLNRAVALPQTVASFSLFCFYLAARNTIRTEPRLLRTYLLCLVLIGAAQALYGTLAHITDLSISWLEPLPPAHSKVAHGSFPNRNHYAAFLLPAFACALALALGQSTRLRPLWRSNLRRWLDFFNSPTLLMRVAMLMLVIGVVLSQSRMGNTALAAGVTVFALIWLLLSRNVLSFGKVALLFASIALVDVLLVGERFGLEKVIDRIEETDLDGDTRSVARQMAWQLIDRFGWTGAGHGSFALLEHQVRPGPNLGYLHHVHNDHLELIIEFGWVGYGMLVALLAAHVGMALRALSSRRSLTRACGTAFIMCSVAAILHATVEYIFHTPGWRALFVAMMAMVAALPAPGTVAKRKNLNKH